MMSKVEEARYEQMMLNEERVEPIEWGLHWHEHNFDRTALSLSLSCWPTGLPFTSEAQLSFCFSSASLPVSTLASLLSISTESVSLSVSWQLMPNLWLCFTGQASSSTPTVTIPQSSSLAVSQWLSRLVNCNGCFSHVKHGWLFVSIPTCHILFLWTPISYRWMTVRQAYPHFALVDAHFVQVDDCSLSLPHMPSFCGCPFCQVDGCPSSFPTLHSCGCPFCQAGEFLV